MKIDFEYLEKSLQDPEAVVQTQFLPYDDIIPLGFSAENALTFLKNNSEVERVVPPFGTK